jgi:sodium/pantothenate symporter
MNIYTITIFVSILVYIGIGNYAGRKVKDLNDYVVAGRNAPTLMIVGTLVASYLSTNTFLGEAGFAYGNNAGGWLLMPPLAAAGYVYGAVFFGRYLRRSRALTVAEFFGRRFNDDRVRFVAGATVIIGIGCYLIAVTQGASLILSEIAGIDYQLAVLVVWISYTSFTLYAGSRGVVITDTLMFLLFSSVTLFALYYLLDIHDGWLSALGELAHLEGKPDLLEWFGQLGPDRNWQTPAEFLVWYCIVALAWSFVTAISPWQSSRYLMARNEHVVLRSACIAAVCVVSIQTLFYVGAIVVNVSNPNIEPIEKVMVWASMNLMPSFLGALVLSGVVAAALSSATTFLSLVGFNLSNDILRRSVKTDNSALRYSRLMMFATSMVALIVCLSAEPQIFWLTYFAGTLFASAWGPVALMSIWSERITAAAALWGIVAGFLGNVIPKLLSLAGLVDWPVYLDPILIGAALSLITVFVVSANTEITREERDYRESLFVAPREDVDPGRIVFTLKVAHLIGGFGLFAAAALMAWLVLPLSEIKDEAGLAAWFSLEALFAYSWIPLFALCSYLVIYGTGRSYVSRLKMKKP